MLEATSEAEINQVSFLKKPYDVLYISTSIFIF